jgi:hypothetical protein
VRLAGGPAFGRRSSRSREQLRETRLHRSCGLVLDGSTAVS